MNEADTTAVNNYQHSDFEDRLVNMAQAAAVIESNDRIWGSGLNCAPTEFFIELCKRHKTLENVGVIAGLLMRPFDFFKPEFKGHINYNNFFYSALEKNARQLGNTVSHSYHLSEIAQTLREVHKPNVFAITVSEPDERGYMSMDPCGGVGNKTALEMAEKVILSVNKALPRVTGENNQIHVSQATHIAYTDAAIPLLSEVPADEIANEIADHIVQMIKDGDTLQIGIGAIPNTVGYRLDTKKDLGVHTEMLTNCVVHLAKKGVVTGKYKNYYPNKIVFSFSAGSQVLLDFLDNNDDVLVLHIEKCDDCRVVGKNDNYVSINTCLMVDLTGQVASESVGFTQVSGTGGQLDLVRSARFSKGGRSFIALKSSRILDGETHSNILLAFPPGTAVTTPRSDVQYVVTEYGIANMRQQNLESRVKSLIAIAHPSFRESLHADAVKVGLLRE